MTDLSKEFENIDSKNIDVEVEDANYNPAQEFINYLDDPKNSNKAMVVHGRLIDPEEHLVISVFSPTEFMLQFLESEYRMYLQAEKTGRDSRVDEDPSYYEPYIKAVRPMLEKVYIKYYLKQELDSMELTPEEKELINRAYQRYLYGVATKEAEMKEKPKASKNNLESLLRSMERMSK